MKRAKLLLGSLVLAATCALGGLIALAPAPQAEVALGPKCVTQCPQPNCCYTCCYTSTGSLVCPDIQCP